MTLEEIIEECRNSRPRLKLLASNLPDNTDLVNGLVCTRDDAMAAKVRILEMLKGNNK